MSIGNFLQRLAGGNVNPSEPQDQQQMGQFINSVPRDQFQQYTGNAVRQMDPNEYNTHITPGLGGTNPLGGLGKSLLGSLAGSLVGNMLGNQMGGGLTGTVGSLAGSLLGSSAASGGIGGLQNMLGLSTQNPNQMNEGDVASLARHAQQNNPDALAQTAAQYQDRPDVLHSLLGNKGLLLAGGALAAAAMSGKLPGITSNFGPGAR